MNSIDVNLNLKGNVFNIQRYTVHDGPGIRTEVFLKGCPLRCKWCGNPESYKLKSEVGVFTKKCIGTDKCGLCLKTCKVEGAIQVEDGKVKSIDRNLCTGCMECVDSCCSNTLKRWGTEMTVDEVMDIILADRSFYEKSGGGVTISGGESLLQWQFTLEIVKACRKASINTCIETALHCDSKILDEVLPYTDILITDIKHMDTDIHKTYTGVGNELTLKNIKKVTEYNVPLVLRIPCIPNVNDDMDNIKKTGEFVVNELDNKVNQLQLLRFRRLGEEKYESLGLPYKMADINVERSDAEDYIRSIAKTLQDMGIEAVAGTSHEIKL